MRNRFGFFATLAAIVTLTLSAGSVPATAQYERQMHVSWWLANQSDSCIWVTVYWSYESEAHWRIAGGPSRPNWVRPGGMHRGGERFYHTPLTPQLRWRVEMPHPGNKNCSGKDGRNFQTQRNFRRSNPNSQRLDTALAQVYFTGNKTSGYKLYVGNVVIGP